MSEVWKPSVTVAAIVEDQGKFLIIEERTTDGIKLNQPAGHLDPGESPESGAIRECMEESAWKIEPTGMIGVYLSRYTSTRTGHDVTYLRFAFAAKPVQHVETATLDKEILKVHWFTFEELKNNVDQHRSPLVLKCVEDYLAIQLGKKVMTPLDQVYTHPSVINGPMPPGLS
ncbi:MAG: NUDIX hydrolase [Limnobacter sp.]|nr:NUDIX hydrolase [Limnobacter sp.]